MGFFSKLFSKVTGGDSAMRDARQIYERALAQSRQPAFYGQDRFADTYDGRIDVLTVHIAGLLSALNRFGEQGERLGQALFDVMKDDFEIALREEGLSDAGVAKRIKPMIGLFYTRVKRYAEALRGEAAEAGLTEAFTESLDGEAFAKPMAEYLQAFDGILAEKSLGEIAMARFHMPEPPTHL
jgi:cytochrome b pre-mRNA-processing protein 3